MKSSSIKKSLIISFVTSMIVSPSALVAIILYCMFSGITASLLFNTIKVETVETTRFSFRIEPQFLLVLLGVFAVTLLISLLFTSLTKSSK